MGLTLTLAYGVSLWLVLNHAVAGEIQASVPPLLVHWLWESLLALPVVAVAVWLGLAVAGRLLRGRDGTRTPALHTAVTAGAVALAATAAFAIGGLVHNALYPVEHAHETAVLSHTAQDALLALAAALALSVLLVAMVRRRSTLGAAVPSSYVAPALGATIEGAGVGGALLLEAGTTRRRILQYGAAGAVAVSATGALRAYAAPFDESALSDKVDPCFDKSPRGRPFTRELVIPPVLEPVARTAEADVYEIAEMASASEIIAGIRTPSWGYNGISPGPTIMARKGRRVEVTFTNRLPADGDPDGLIIKTPADPKTNPFIEPGTVVHLHGINADPISDGYATDVRLPGDSLRHRYPNNDDQRPATLWYHDHSLHITAHHLFRGLAGLYILSDEVEDALELPKGYGRYDIPLVIDDVMIDPDTGVLYYDNCSHFGAFGDVMVVNGYQQPRLQVANRKYRFRILNASDARQYVLALDDGSTFHTIGSDHGLLDAPVATDNQHLVVAERVEIVIDFARYPVGSRVVLVNKLVDPDDPVHQIMAFDVTREEPDDTPLPATLRPTGDPAPPRAKRRFELARNGGMWTINGLRFDQNRVDAFPQLNSTEEWELATTGGGWGHPMHIHLGRFKIIDIQGRARRPDETGWKDTVWVGPNQTVRVVHEFKNYTGRFQFHCHNSSHEDHTMMTQFEVIAGPPEDGPAPPRSPEPDGAPQQVPPPPESTTTPPPDEFAKFKRGARKRRRKARRRRSTSKARRSRGARRRDRR